MDSIPNLSEPDLDDFFLGSLETNNIINNHLDNYLSSLTTFPNFSSHIPSSVVGTSIHSTRFTTNPLQSLPTTKNSIQNKLCETKTPRTVSFATNVSPVSAATDSKLPSVTSNHPFSTSSHDNATDHSKPTVLPSYASPANIDIFNEHTILLSLFTNLDEDSHSNINDASTSSISISSVNIITSNHQIKTNKQNKKNKKTKIQQK